MSGTGTNAVLPTATVGSGGVSDGRTRSFVIVVLPTGMAIAASPETTDSDSATRLPSHSYRMKTVSSRLIHSSLWFVKSTEIVV